MLENRKTTENPERSTTEEVGRQAGTTGERDGDELREREYLQEQGGHNDEDPYERAQHDEPPETHEESGGNKVEKNQRRKEDRKEVKQD